jgi:hypothetical protein
VQRDPNLRKKAPVFGKDAAQMAEQNRSGGADGELPQLAQAARVGSLARCT